MSSKRAPYVSVLVLDPAFLCDGLPVTDAHCCYRRLLESRFLRSDARELVLGTLSYPSVCCSSFSTWGLGPLDMPPRITSRVCGDV
ncbi:hypothetical protein CPAR01_02982 [Colletotrichum paranaense]|nr:uncharacterized protein CCOS01_13761 [Colletotrichum costaricense]XP_060354597.1 uncharacterized protein CPAR01_02982 [Colletotrichum paranaense]XP_060389095.1 uncharacterized protein CTAM01_00417 [Colletotrichum tamarilloi]XP_060390513.1 uncharacterized protein CABS01_04297 [Colletotrichum abscissum]KAI3545036.1 hypothetical protein CSPX01_05242 [Colletotrichum filicis]KAK1451969.1 hypothetical protein CMEL01_06543 [Colletotrichum melonis]KAK1711343.1 hypothetical protein BDP67DRAFT_51888